MVDCWFFYNSQYVWKINGEKMIEHKKLKQQIQILNQIFEIEKKTLKLNEKNSINRNIDKLKDIFENTLDEKISFIIENPIKEKYKETRTDVEASISGDSTENLIIVDVIKPIIRLRQDTNSQIIQKGIVVVQDEKTIVIEQSKGIEVTQKVKKKPLNSIKKSQRESTKSARRLKKEQKRKGK